MSTQSRTAQITPADLRRLYEEALESGADAAYRKRRWGRAAELVEWLEQDALGSLSAENALQLYRASGGRESSAFSGTAIEELRDALDFLLYDTIKLEGRFDECVSPQGGYKLPGAGREFVSWLLCLRNPQLLGVWNSNAERMLKRIGGLPRHHEPRASRHTLSRSDGSTCLAACPCGTAGLHRIRRPRIPVDQAVWQAAKPGRNGQCGA